MAGTDSTQFSGPGAAHGKAPVVILDSPQLGENIGMAARAMLNCGLNELRLVAPRDGWPNEAAVAAAAGADPVLDRAQVFGSVAEAVGDLDLVFAATARPRDMTKESVAPREAVSRMRERISFGGRAAVLFGREAKGLTNDDVALADAILTVPLNPGFASLNLAQAVFCVGYEWMLASAAAATDAELTMPKESRPATKEQLIGLFEHLESELIACGFLRVAEKRTAMARNLRNLFQRASLTDQEVRTLRGVIAGLVKGPKG